MCAIPHGFFRFVFPGTLPAPGDYAVGNIFLPLEASDATHH